MLRKIVCFLLCTVFFCLHATFAFAFSDGITLPAPPTSYVWRVKLSSLTFSEGARWMGGQDMWSIKTHLDDNFKIFTSVYHDTNNTRETRYINENEAVDYISVNGELRVICHIYKDTNFADLNKNKSQLFIFGIYDLVAQ